jgi:hypothetical protein
VSAAFRRAGDRVRMELEPFEVLLLRSTRDGVRDALLSGEADDPILRRLFPPAVSGDDDADAELRGLLHDDLLGSRLAGLDAIVEILDRGRDHRGRRRVDLIDDEPQLVLGVLNDLRLAIGARVGVERLDPEELLRLRRSAAEDDPVVYRLAVMDHLGGLQEQLLAILDPESVSFYADIDEEDLE